jgi:DNA-binding protein HU-beta
MLDISKGHKMIFLGKNVPIKAKELCMNKTELIETIAKETELSKAAARRALEVVLATIVKSVAKKQDVQLIGFGTFKAAKRAARAGKNPRTGDVIKIAAATVPKFSAGVAFKAAVNKKK